MREYMVFYDAEQYQDFNGDGLKCRALMCSVKQKTEEEIQMAKSVTKSEVIKGVAEAAEITKKQAVAALEALVNMAYKGAKDGFMVPGLGKLVLVNRKARKGRNPATGEIIDIPAKRVVKFRVAKIAKVSILK